MNKSKIAWAGMLVCLAFAGTSDARSVGGYAGQPAGGSGLGCFGEAFGAVRGNCGGNQFWHVPMVVDSGGAKTVNITGSAGPAALSCTPYALNDTETLFWAGSQLNWVNQGPTKSTSTGANVPSGGYLYAYCSFSGTGAQVDGLNWNP